MHCLSLPVRGAWIEILETLSISRDKDMSLPVRGAWIEISNSYLAYAVTQSLPVRGAWIEILQDFMNFLMLSGRSPCGERGLKWVTVKSCPSTLRSLPVRGAWIEMAVKNCHTAPAVCRSPCGERGLKYIAPVLCPLDARRSPCGERGLKFHQHKARIAKCTSLPVRGAWIEIAGVCGTGSMCKCRSPCGERGLKCRTLCRS